MLAVVFAALAAAAPECEAVHKAGDPIVALVTSPDDGGDDVVDRLIGELRDACIDVRLGGTFASPDLEVELPRAQALRKLGAELVLVVGLGRGAPFLRARLLRASTLEVVAPPFVGPPRDVAGRIVAALTAASVERGAGMRPLRIVLQGATWADARQLREMLKAGSEAVDIVDFRAGEAQLRVLTPLEAEKAAATLDGGKLGAKRLVVVDVEPGRVVVAVRAAP